MHRATRLLICLSALCLTLASGSNVAAQPLFTVPRLAPLSMVTRPASEGTDSRPATSTLVAMGPSGVKVTPIGGRTVQVTTTLTVANQSAAVVRKLQLTIPSTVLTSIGGQSVLDVTFGQQPKSTRQTPSGLEATYVVPEVVPGQVLTLTQTYTVHLGDSTNAPVTANDPQAFLEAETGVESDDPTIQAKARQLTAGQETVAAKAAALLQFVSHYIRYDRSSASRNKGALASLQSGSGVCSEYASLFVALARSSGIPARLVYGWANDTGLKASLDGSQRHAWAEYYLPERGWISADPTFASVLPPEQATFFDAEVHLAQDWTQADYAEFSGSYTGEGILSITIAHQLADASTVAKR